MLAGARLRRNLQRDVLSSERSMTGAASYARPASERGPELELLVPNPSGARGTYILPWKDVDDLCRPTMHDVCLGQTLASRLGQNEPLTPGILRRAARAVALQGLAGRDAARAAQRAVDQEARLRIATRMTLLQYIFEQVIPAAAHHPMERDDDPKQLEQQGRIALEMLAKRLGTAPETAVERLELLATCFVELGLGPQIAEAPVPCLIADLSKVRAEMMAWSQTHTDSDVQAQVGRKVLAIATATERASVMAQVPTQAARNLTRDMATLFAEALSRPDQVIDTCGRARLLLDGWDRITQLWLTAQSDSHQAAAISEMQLLLPVMPEEMETWLKLPVGTSARMNQRTPTAATATPTSRNDRIARNELLLAKIAT